MLNIQLTDLELDKAYPEVYKAMVPAGAVVLTMKVRWQRVGLGNADEGSGYEAYAFYVLLPSTQAQRRIHLTRSHTLKVWTKW